MGEVDDAVAAANTSREVAGADGGGTDSFWGGTAEVCTGA